MPTIHERRRINLQQRLATLEIDALLVTNLLNVRYLTGFNGSNAALLVPADGEAIFATDGRYVTQSAAQVPDLERVIERAVATALVGRGNGRIGFEALTVTVAQHEALSRNATLVSTRNVIEDLREIKDETEIDTLREACAIADRVFADLLAAGGIRAGRTEREVGLDLDERMRRLGADDPSFETIVAAGPNSAIPHHRPTGAELRTGDFVKFDFGAAYLGYHSDMTRTVVLGPPADWQSDLYALVRTAQQAAKDLAAPDIPCKDVDAAARNPITEAGYGDRFLHGLGHGIGLEIHEAPAVAATSTGTMTENMVLTIEPGVYLEGRGGVRIEDSGVIRGAGYDVLTLTTTDLLVL